MPLPDPDGQRSPRSAEQQPDTVPRRSAGPQAVLASNFNHAPGDPFLSTYPQPVPVPGPAQPQRTARARARGDARHEQNTSSSHQHDSPTLRRARAGGTTLVPEGAPFRLSNMCKECQTSQVIQLRFCAEYAGVEYLRTVSVANTAGTTHNVPGSLQTVRVVSPVPGDDNFTSLDRALSASSFESMHSIDHGSLGLDSIQHQYEAPADGGGPWVASARAANPPGRYEAFHEPSSANICRQGEASADDYSGPDIAVHYGVRTPRLLRCAASQGASAEQQH